MKRIIDYIAFLIFSVIFILVYIIFIPKNLINNILIIIFTLVNVGYSFSIIKKFLRIKELEENIKKDN